jgi:hypothetical protein
LRRRQILPEHLLQLDGIGIAQLKQIADYLIAWWDIGLVRNDRYALSARIFPCPDHLHDIWILWNE